MVFEVNGPKESRDHDNFRRLIFEGSLKKGFSTDITEISIYLSQTSERFVVEKVSNKMKSIERETAEAVDGVYWMKRMLETENAISLWE